MTWFGRRLAAFGVLAAILASMLTALSVSAQEIPAQGPRAQSPHVTASLLSDHEVATPGQTITAALRLDIIPKWHSYYLNPGDSGEATSLTWTLPEGWSAGDLQWPVPSIVFEGPIATYAYYGSPTYPVELTVPADAAAGLYPLSAEAFWLVCEKICVPEWATLSFVLEVGPEPVVSADRDVIEAALEALPPQAPETGVLSAAGDALVLEFAADALGFAPADAARLYFFSDNETAVEHGLEQSASLQDGVWRIEAPLQANARPFSALSGMVALGDKGAHDRPAFRVTAVADEPLGAVPTRVEEGSGSSGSGAGPGTGQGSEQSAGKPSGGAPLGGPMSLPRAMLFALLGGMILNLMPCVFPVLSMKAAGFLQHAHEPAALRRHGLLFTLGVLVAFAGLFALIMSLRGAAGGAGWGFQLQNPVVVFALIMIMMAVGLSLAGVFELGGSLQNVGAGGGAGGQSGEAAFNTGLLAVIVAAPCTAPFMAPALGFAFLQPPVVAGGVFLALAAGFALPMLALSYMPWLWRAMPKPGAWMATLKTVLAFPMFLTAAWLVWVLEGVAGGDAVLLALAASVALSFGLWIWGRTQHAQGRALGAKAVAVAAFGAVVYAGAQTPTAAAEAVSAEIRSTQTAEGAWSPERVAALRAEGRIVYVDFTAKWCITCQANKRTVILTDTIQDAFAERGVAFLTADWTKRDPAITAELQKFGRAGVPLNIIFGPQGVTEVEVLPSLLTQDIVLDALDRVEGRAAAAAGSTGKGAQP